MCNKETESAVYVSDIPETLKQAKIMKPSMSHLEPSKFYCQAKFEDPTKIVA